VRFIFGFSKLEILFGRQTREEVSSLYRNISKRAVEFRQERVTSIDPHACHVVTDARTYEPDILVPRSGVAGNRRSCRRSRNVTSATRRAGGFAGSTLSRTWPS
jgi:NADH dehydrogenase FAD-containing subunit